MSYPPRQVKPATPQRGEFNSFHTHPAITLSSGLTATSPREDRRLKDSTLTLYLPKSYFLAIIYKILNII
jgi:hypothetical protein